MDRRDIQIYVLTDKGVYLYVPEQSLLQPVAEGDHRQDVRGNKPAVNLVLVAEDGSSRFADTDAGYVSQNIFLACTSLGLATVSCGSMDEPAFRKACRLNDRQRIISFIRSATPDNLCRSLSGCGRHEREAGCCRCKPPAGLPVSESGHSRRKVGAFRVLSLPVYDKGRTFHDTAFVIIGGAVACPLWASPAGVYSMPNSRRRFSTSSSFSHPKNSISFVTSLPWSNRVTSRR